MEWVDIGPLIGVLPDKWVGVPLGARGAVFAIRNVGPRGLSPGSQALVTPLMSANAYVTSSISNMSPAGHAHSWEESQVTNRRSRASSRWGSKLTGDVVTADVLADASMAPRTRLRYLVDHQLRCPLLLELWRPPSFVLLAGHAFMPLHCVPSALAPVTCVADEKGIRTRRIPLTWLVDLARATAIFETPVEVGDAPQRSLCREHLVPGQGLAAQTGPPRPVIRAVPCKHLLGDIGFNLMISERVGAKRAPGLIPAVLSEMCRHPFADTGRADTPLMSATLTEPRCLVQRPFPAHAAFEG